MSRMSEAAWALIIVYAVAICAVAKGVGDIAGEGWGSIVFGLGVLFAAFVAGICVLTNWASRS